ncbi:MAG: FG-GAP repeat protein [Planctomycetota bacterium]|nr:FG-GAP repeat protein [Planctomycetota bacterium]
MRHLMPLLAAAASVLSPAPAYADLGDQLAKLLADDGAAFDIFGISVAIRGATAIVGAYHDDDNGSLSGSAYLFDSAAPGKCPWDLDAGGSVGILDLLALLAAWGTNPGASRPTSTATAPSASSTCSHCWPTGARAREEGSHEP